MLKQATERRAIKHFSIIGFNCPSCNQEGIIEQVEPFQRSVFKIYTHKHTHIYELSHTNGICQTCKNGFRISNGCIIERERKWIEIPSKYIGYFMIGIFIVCLMVIVASTAYYRLPENNEVLLSTNSNDLKFYRIIILASLGVLLSIGIPLFIYAKLFPIVLLQKRKNNDPKIDYRIPIKKDLKQSEKEFQELYNFAQYQENIINQNEKAIFNLSSVLTQTSRLQKFDTEKELQMYIANNIDSFTFQNRKIALYPRGVEYNITGVGRIDILATDEDGNFIIIETKVDRAPDKTMGQISRYIGWVDQHLNKNNKQVFGLIIGHRMDTKLKYATRLSNNIFLLEYDLDLNLRNIK